MKAANVRALENLSMFCQISGIMTVILGIVVIFLNLQSNDFDHIQVGFFVLASGYAFVKISAKLSKVLISEWDPKL